MTEHYQTEAQIAEVRKLLKAGYSKRKIMESIAGLSDRTLRNYIHTIHERDKIEWDNEAKESLEGRALTIKRKYQELADTCETIMRDDTKSPRDRIEAGKTGIACENNIYNMIKDGPLRFNTIVGKELEKKNGTD